MSKKVLYLLRKPKGKDPIFLYEQWVKWMHVHFWKAVFFQDVYWFFFSPSLTYNFTTTKKNTVNTELANLFNIKGRDTPQLFVKSCVHMWEDVCVCVWGSYVKHQLASADEACPYDLRLLCLRLVSADTDEPVWMWPSAAAWLCLPLLPAPA